MVMYHSDPLLLQHMLYVIEIKELKWIDRGDDFSYHVAIQQDNNFLRVPDAHTYQHKYKVKDNHFT